MKLEDDWIGAISRRMRRQRFERFAALAEALPKPLTILDVGGRAAFWAAHGWAGRSDVRIITGNIEPQRRDYANIEPVTLDATDLSNYPDSGIDIVFSNSVIEHLSSWDNQVKMASEVRRVARAYWVQTPNYWFPMEPHFRVPGWQWLPAELRIALLRRRAFGLRGRCAAYGRAATIVREIRLLSARELRTLFPNAILIGERYLSLVKSWVVVGGQWNAVAREP